MSAAIQIRPEGALVSALDLVLRPAGGRRDAALFDALSQTGLARPGRVSAVIEAGFRAPDAAAAPAAAPGWAWLLSLPDRQIALFRLALDHGRWPAWFVTLCGACGKPADLRVGRDEFALTPGARPLPAGLVLSRAGHRARFAIPAGAQEAALAAGADLAGTCLTGGDRRRFAAAFEAALAPLLPRIVTELRFPCPCCGAETGYWFDPLDWIARHAGQALVQVDRLARAYGWSEAAILRMPAARRQTYLALLGEPA